MQQISLIEDVGKKGGTSMDSSIRTSMQEIAWSCAVWMVKGRAQQGD
jgi:hypothetical protein